MAIDQLEMLNSQTHRALRTNPLRGGRPHFVQIVAAEFAAAAATCPLFIVKNAETGQFYAGAMFGFKVGEDLLTSKDGDCNALLPLDLERQGFYVSGDGIAIDPAHLRFSTTTGEHLFDDQGQPTAQLRHMQRVLTGLATGIVETDRFIADMLARKLIEPIDVSLGFDDGEQLVLEGLYSVSLDALQDLGDTDVVDLFRKGHLQLAYTMVGSLRQVSMLAHRRNRRLGEI
jgi:hypothetical protein